MGAASCTAAGSAAAGAAAGSCGAGLCLGVLFERRRSKSTPSSARLLAPPSAVPASASGGAAAAAPAPAAAAAAPAATLGFPPSSSPSPAARLRSLLNRHAPGTDGADIIVMPCAYDALTARLIERGGFELSFMTGFGVSAAHGFPDCQLVSYQEMLDSAFRICSGLHFTLCIGDGDTGYGNAVNVKRTVRGYAQAGMAGIMLEDQVAPKRCGHTRGKAVVSRAEAVARIRAACDARDEGPRDIVILARTDARGGEGLEEAIDRCKAFAEAGADITFLEAPLSREEMVRYCREVPGHKMCNMLGGGKTPVLHPAELHKIGFTLAAYPLTLLSAGLRAQEDALRRLKQGDDTSGLEFDFETVKDIVGFNDYYAEEDRYKC